MKNKKRLFFLIFIIVIIVIILLICGYFIIGNKFKSKSVTSDSVTIKVPDMVGENSGTAQEVLEKLGLKVKIKETTDDSQEDLIGKVYKQNVVGKIQKKKTIILSVYVSSTELKMPDVVGMNKDDAKDILEKLGFSVTLEEKESDKENGVVIEQSSSSKKLVKGSLINLAYSKKKDNDVDNVKEENTTNSSSNDNEKSNIQQPSTTPQQSEIPQASVPKISLSGGKSYIRKGYGGFYYSVTSDESLSGYTIIWSSSNESVAKVTSSGYVYATGSYGVVTITATIAGTSSSASKKVTVVSIKGDISGDGKVNANDAAIALDYAYYGTTDSVILSVIDLNGDGKIDSTDSNMILDYYKYGYWK